MITCFPIGPEDTIARLHAAVGTVNDGMLQNVRESIVRRANKCVEVEVELFENLL
jgi:spore maturation protein SpmA